MLESFNQMAAGTTGKRNVGRLMLRLSESPQGARMLANFVKDQNNTPALTDLFTSLNSDKTSQQMLGLALQELSTNPRARGQMELFEGRSEVAPALQEQVSQALESAVGKTLSEEVPRLVEGMPLLEQGAQAQTRTTGRTVEQSPDGSGSDDKPEDGREEGAPALDALRNGALRREVGEAVEVRRRQNDLGTLSDAWKGEARVRTTGETAPPLAPGEKEPQREESRQDSGRFRPGDYYSEETLRQARICADCGYRTTTTGWCPRCAVAQRS